MITFCIFIDLVIKKINAINFVVPLLSTVQIKTNPHFVRILYKLLFLDSFFSSTLPNGKVGKGKVEEKSRKGNVQGLQNFNNNKNNNKILNPFQLDKIFNCGPSIVKKYEAWCLNLHNHERFQKMSVYRSKTIAIEQKDCILSVLEHLKF
ncbi:hypothetical protein BpHYR1_022376 [Brachionus plicatilis]|uniref:Uncharacterized protein n=1 Tax=Brachionus plicatilis TaxID=10195 RepID=A0A3M7T3V2_BRAPC|nr:hypothetical protein BpHYR1_022376 [Brachionus plicatilis]